MDSYKILARKFLAEYTYAFRISAAISQEKMAENLRISVRAYGDLERGKYCFSAVSLLFLLLLLDEDQLLGFLGDFRGRVYTFELQQSALICS